MMNSGKRDRNAFEPSDDQEGSSNRRRLDDNTRDGEDSANDGKLNDAVGGEDGTVREDRDNEASEDLSDDESIESLELVREHFESITEVNQFELSDRLSAGLKRVPLSKSRLAYCLDLSGAGFAEGWQEFRLRKSMLTLVEEGWTFQDLVEEVLSKHENHNAGRLVYFHGVFVWLNPEVVIHIGGNVIGTFAERPIRSELVHDDRLPTLFCPLSISISGTIPDFVVLGMSQEGVLAAIPGLIQLISALRPKQIGIEASGTFRWTYNSYANDLVEVALSKGFSDDFLVPGTSLREFLIHNPQLERLTIGNRVCVGLKLFDLEQAEALIHCTGEATQLDLPVGLRGCVGVAEAHGLRKKPASLRGDLRAPLVGLAIGKVVKSLQGHASKYAPSLIFVTLRDHVGVLFSGNGHPRGQAQR